MGAGSGAGKPHRTRDQKGGGPAAGKGGMQPVLDDGYSWPYRKPHKRDIYQISVPAGTGQTGDANNGRDKMVKVIHARLFRGPQFSLIN